MKQFASLTDGLNYVTVCPMCHTPTDINDLDADLMPISVPYETPHNKDLKGKLQFDLYDTDILNLDIETGTAELIRDAMMSSYNTSQMYAGGTLLVRLGVDCNDCCQYNYLLQLHIDLTKMALIKTVLDSETLSIEKGDVVHEIKNSYVKDETMYYIVNRSRSLATQMTSDGMQEIQQLTDTVDKSITLPLFPLDLLNPEETLQRITKLIVFS